MQVNHHQEGVLDFIRRGTGHGVVEATAGSGKTTTLVFVARLLVDELGLPPADIAFLAFNRSAADELVRRLPAGVTALTLHALGRRVLGSAGLPVEVDEEKYERLAATVGVPDHARRPLAEVSRMARLELAEPAEAQRIAARYRIDLPLTGAEAVDSLSRLLDAGAADDKVDFTDLHYLPVRLSLRMPAFSFLCVDEAQDLSRLALTFVGRLVDAGARALFVGDPSQAIYAFAGADAGSLERIVSGMSARRLPLSVSYRCPVRHVVLARRFSPEMQHVPGASAGRVGVSRLASLPADLRPGDLVLSRTNGPLLDAALAVAGKGQRVVVLGDELLAGANALAAKLGAASRAIGHADVRRSLDAERQRLEREQPLGPGLPHDLEANRVVHTAVALALARAASPTAEHVVAELGDLFPAVSPDAEEGAAVGPPPHVLLSTVHKAKGREAERVFLLAPEELGIGADDRHERPARRDQPEGAPSPAEEDDCSEANVLFVALTRAKRELVFVERSPGAIARRLAAHEANGPPGWLARWWDDVLRLATVMSRDRRRPDLSSQHDQARRVQDARRQAGGGRRVAGGRQDSVGHRHR